MWDSAVMELWECLSAGTLTGQLIGGRTDVIGRGDSVAHKFEVPLAAS
jgi:hypothetical protein